MGISPTAVHAAVLRRRTTRARSIARQTSVRLLAVGPTRQASTPHCHTPAVAAKEPSRVRVKVAAAKAREARGRTLADGRPATTPRRPHTRSVGLTASSPTSQACDGRRLHRPASATSCPSVRGSCTRRAGPRGEEAVGPSTAPHGGVCPSEASKVQTVRLRARSAEARVQARPISKRLRARRGRASPSTSARGANAAGVPFVVRGA